jgi:hypothetical protein
MELRAYLWRGCQALCDQGLDLTRIERLMGETYGRGYFSLDELRPSARETLAAQLRGVRVNANPCTGWAARV